MASPAQLTAAYGDAGVLVWNADDPACVVVASLLKAALERRRALATLRLVTQEHLDKYTRIAVRCATRLSRSHAPAPL